MKQARLSQYATTYNFSRQILAMIPQPEKSEEAQNPQNTTRNFDEQKI